MPTCSAGEVLPWAVIEEKIRSVQPYEVGGWVGSRPLQPEAASQPRTTHACMHADLRARPPMHPYHPPSSTPACPQSFMVRSMLSVPYFEKVRGGSF